MQCKHFVTFQGIGNSTLTFAQNLNAPIVFEEPVVVSFYLPLTLHNPLILMCFLLCTIK